MTESVALGSYSRPFISEADVRAVTEALGSPIISQGAILVDFERAFASHCASEHAVAFSSGTAALHAMCAAAGITTGDEVIVPALTFASTSNAVIYCGAVPVFADIDPSTLCLDPDSVRRRITERTRAILTVDFAGHPSSYEELRALAQQHELLLLSDAAHAPGAVYRGSPVGSLADLTAFSFNPVKNMTTGEGGMVTTDDAEVAAQLRQCRVHGMTRERERLRSVAPADWYYEQQFLGYNYKINEMSAALGLSQLKRLPEMNARRTELANLYSNELGGLPLELPPTPKESSHAWHLYVVRLPSNDRDTVFSKLRSQGIGVQLHYIPVPLHPWYREQGFTMAGLSATQLYYRKAMSIPLHQGMSDEDVTTVVRALANAL